MKKAAIARNILAKFLNNQTTRWGRINTGSKINLNKTHNLSGASL
jgi:hypothetical protein